MVYLGRDELRFFIELSLTRMHKYQKPHLVELQYPFILQKIVNQGRVFTEIREIPHCWRIHDKVIVCLM